MEKTKACSKCGKEFPLNLDYFSSRKGTKDGFHQQCRNCLSEHKKQYAELHKAEKKKANKEYQEAHRQKIIAYKKEYYEKNKNIILEKQKEYAAQNAEQIRERRAIYYSENADEIKQKVKTYHAQNSEAIQKYRKKNKNRIVNYQSQYYKDNKDYYANHNKNYLAQHREERNVYKMNRIAKKSALEHSLTYKKWGKIKEEFNNCCAYCGQKLKLTQDHFIPLIKDGAFTEENILPACSSCNSSKRDKDYYTWYKTQPFYTEERHNKIMQHIRA